MSVPRRVEEEAQMAEELHARMFSPAQQEEEETQQTEDETKDTQEDQEESQTEQQEEESQQSDEEEVENDVPHDDELDELRKFKARYLSLKGKYNAEVPKLQTELRELKQSVFERLEQAVNQKQQEQAKPKESAEPDLISQFEEEYGPDFVAKLRAVVQAETDAKIKTSIQPVQDQVLSVEETQIKAAQQSFMSFLDEQAPDWRDLWEGKDPKFIDFLQQPDPSGLYTYGELVQQYNNNWDADRLSKVFNLYKEQTAPPKKPEQPNPAKTAMVAPSRNTTHVAPKADDKPVWTKDTISGFEKNDRMGKYTPEQSKQMWDDLLLAMTEGRIH